MSYADVPRLHELAVPLKLGAGERQGVTLHGALETPGTPVGKVEAAAEVHLFLGVVSHYGEALSLALRAFPLPMHDLEESAGGPLDVLRIRELARRTERARFHLPFTNPT